MATFLELQTYCQRHGWRDQTANGLAQLKVWINDVLQFLALERRWPFYETTGYFNLAPPYTTGTVAITQGATAVAGTSTVWASGMVGQDFYQTDDAGHAYMVSAVGGNTSLTLASGFLGDTVTVGTYQIRYIRYAAATDWGQEGVFLFEDGRELNYYAMTLADFHRLRMTERGTCSYPDFVCKVNLAGTDYFYVHPAPSAAAQIRYTYWRAPATLTNNTDAADMPAPFRGLLHEALRIRLSVDDSNAALEAMRSREYQRMIDKLFHVQGSNRPMPVRGAEGGIGPRIGLNALASIFQIE